MSTQRSEESGFVMVSGKLTDQHNLNQELPASYATKPNKRYLYEINENLKHELIATKARMKDLIRDHKKETYNLKKAHDKRVSEMFRKVEKQEEEMRRLKSSKDKLGKAIKEMENKIERERKVGFDRKEEYEKQVFKISGNMEKEMNRLKTQIITLEKTVAEKEEQIIKAREMNDNLSEEFRKIRKRHKSDMAAMRNELLDKIEEKESNTRVILQNIEKLIIEQSQRYKDIERSQRIGQKKNLFPPINGSTSIRRTSLINTNQS